MTATSDLTHIMREFRRFSPRSIRSALLLLADELAVRLATDAAAIHLPAEKTVYVSGWPPGLKRSALAKTLRIGDDEKHLWIRLDGKDEKNSTGESSPSFLKVPLFDGNRRYGALVLIKMDPGGFGRTERLAVPALSEILSFRLLPLIDTNSTQVRDDHGEAAKIELIDSVGDDRSMRRILKGMMELAGCEYCAFHSAIREERLYIMLDGRELSPRTAEIRSKLANVFQMFSNRVVGEGSIRERVFVKNERKNVAYLLGGTRIESYFIVPVMFASRLQGVLFFGSVRRDAFGREEIERFRGMADEAEEKAPMVYRTADEVKSLARLIDAFPYGAALVSEEGAIRTANRSFGDSLRIRGEIPETVYEIREVSPFDIQGLWEEFRMMQHDLVDRELHGATYPDSSISVTWVRLENMSEDACSFVLIRDMTGSAFREEKTEEFLATVAHELKTPLTALKNSLKIVKDSGAAGVTMHERGEVEYALPASRFLGTAMRTIDRLLMLVNGLQNASEKRAISRPYKPSRVLLKSFLDDATLFFLESMKKKEIDFSIEVADEASVLEFDADHMEQVIHNLLSNSIKHVPAGGRIAVTVARSGGEGYAILPRIPWDYLEPPSLVDITISDSGRGIPSDVIEKINPSPNVTGLWEGVARGLGLYIARKLVRLQGGSLVIDGRRESGSSVHLYLPADSATAEAIRAVYTIKESLEDMIGRGLKPVVYAVTKESPSCWLEIVGEWALIPVIKPGRSEISDTGLYLWPLGERIALGLSADKRLAASPLSVVKNGRGGMRVLQDDSSDAIRLGWGVGAIDGITYADLVSVSLERIAESRAVSILKGESEWTGTEF
jgi:signal transduction histidine kinase